MGNDVKCRAVKITEVVSLSPRWCTFFRQSFHNDSNVVNLNPPPPPSPSLNLGNKKFFQPNKTKTCGIRRKWPKNPIIYAGRTLLEWEVECGKLKFSVFLHPAVQSNRLFFETIKIPTHFFSCLYKPKDMSNSKIRTNRRIERKKKTWNHADITVLLGDSFQTRISSSSNIRKAGKRERTKGRKEERKEERKKERIKVRNRSRLRLLSPWAVHFWPRVRFWSSLPRPFWSILIK